MSETLTPTVVENKLNDLNRKIVETKKKIQLSEGQRKANFEEYEAKKEENALKIEQLKKELKELYASYAKTKTAVQSRKTSGKVDRRTSPCAKERNLEEAIACTDEDNIRLRKKYDLLKYHREKQQRKLEMLTKEREDLTSGKADKLFSKNTENPLRKKIISLEVRLEHIRMMQIKANIVRMKYRTMRSDLKEKSVFYISSLKDQEGNIREQETEIKRLQGVKEEAIDLRDNTQKTLAKEEIVETNSSKERNTLIQKYRERVAERKLELERLERMIFHARPRNDFDTHGKSRVQTTEDITKDEVTRLEEAFAKLHSATGVSKSEDVLNRFLEQRATKDSLQKMRTATEQEKMELERRRQELTAEIETRKFSETKNAEENAEKVEAINRQIAEQRSRKDRTESENRRVQDILSKIVETLSMLCEKLGEVSSVPLPVDPRNVEDPLELIQLLCDKVNEIIEGLGGPEKYLETLDEIMLDKLEVASVATTSAEGKALRSKGDPLFPRFPSSATTVPLSEDEEEVPTRNIVKRQAQQLVDIKSRRKGFNFRR